MRVCAGLYDNYEFKLNELGKERRFMWDKMGSRNDSKLVIVFLHKIFIIKIQLTDCCCLMLELFLIFIYLFICLLSD